MQHAITGDSVSMRRLRATLVWLCLAPLAGSQALADDARGDTQVSRKHIVGTWYVALDAGAFDPGLAGTFLSGIAQFHPDGTFMVSDAGDFGAQSFSGTLATPQYGSWKMAPQRRRIVATALSLEGRKETGEAFGWTKVQFVLKVVDRDRVEVAANVFFLPCDDSPPIPSPLTCPDPLENADAFLPASPPNVPVTLTRIVAGR